MDGNLATTNTLLSVMAAVSALEGIFVIGAGIACFLLYRQATAMYRRTMDMIDGIESRQVAPAVARVNAILDDVKSITTAVKSQTDRVEDKVHDTIGRVDDTVDRVRSTVRRKTSRIIGFLRGARVVLETVLEGRG